MKLSIFGTATIALSTLVMTGCASTQPSIDEQIEHEINTETVTMATCPVENQKAFRAGLSKEELVKFASLPVYSQTITRIVPGKDSDGNSADMRIPNNVYDLFVKGNQCHLRNHYLTEIHEIKLKGGATAIAPTYDDESFDFNCGESSKTDDVTFEYIPKGKYTALHCKVTLTTPRHDVLTDNG